jgi:hypothetical protein
LHQTQINEQRRQRGPPGQQAHGKKPDRPLAELRRICDVQYLQVAGIAGIAEVEVAEVEVAEVALLSC